METTELKRWHAVTVEVYDKIGTLEHEGMAGHWPPGISNDTIMALGQARGILSKARALLGRDIDDARARDNPAAADDPSLRRSGFR